MDSKIKALKNDTKLPCYSFNNVYALKIDYDIYAYNSELLLKFMNASLFPKLEFGYLKIRKFNNYLNEHIIKIVQFLLKNISKMLFIELKNSKMINIILRYLTYVNTNYDCNKIVIMLDLSKINVDSLDVIMFRLMLLINSANSNNNIWPKKLPYIVLYFKSMQTFDKFSNKSTSFNCQVLKIGLHSFDTRVEIVKQTFVCLIGAVSI